MKNKYLISSLLGLIVVAILSLLFAFHLFEGWQLKLSDSLFLPHPARPDIVIIAIDDKSIQAIGRWPWDRSVHAQLVDRLGQKPAAIGLDVSFPEKSSDLVDGQLSQSFKKFPRLVLPIESDSLKKEKEYVLAQTYLLPIPSLRENASLGLVNMIIDSDGITRQSPIVIKALDGQEFKNFAVKILSLSSSKEHQEAAREIPKDLPTIRINFVGKPSSFTHYSYIDVLNGNVPAEVLASKIVLIGATALDLHDNLLTPVSAGAPMSGVETHANLLQTILDKKYLKTESAQATILTLVLIAILSSWILTRLRIIAGSLVVLLFLIAYFLYTIISFDQGTIRNLVYPTLTISLIYIVQIIYKYLSENQQKRFIRKALSYYLSQSVMKDILSHPEKLSLGGKRCELTVLFSDIAGFTTISEKLQAEQLAQILNHYLTRMTRLVFDHQGVLDKYIGDAVMAFWGAPLNEPRHALLACQTALMMQEEITEIKKEWAKIGIGEFEVRIGINTGEMVVGNMGSDLRFDYTLLGDNVNLGSRLEGINKEYGTRIIISQTTYDQVKSNVQARQLDTVAVKGKALGVTIYELRSFSQPTETEREFLVAFEKARQLYQEGKFEMALRLFEEISGKNSTDGPTQTYLRRCHDLIQNPPENWDGVYHAKSK